MTDLRWTFLVVTSGNPSARSNRICQPKVLSVPVPVRSSLGRPWSRRWRISSKYCFIGPPSGSSELRQRSRGFSSQLQSTHRIPRVPLHLAEPRLDVRRDRRRRGADLERAERAVLRGG